MINSLPSERATVLGVIDPDSYTAATMVTVWISAANHHSFMAILSVGDIGSSGTVDAKFRQATDVSGTGAKDITGAAITQLVDTTNDNDQVICNLRATDLDVAGGFDFIEFSVTTAVAASDLSVVLLGFDPRHTPAADLASVVEIVSI